MSRTTLVTLALWAAAALAYPVWHLAATLTHTDALAVALVDLPSVLFHSLAHLPTLVMSGLVWAVAVGAGSALLRRTRYAELSDCERAVFGGALGMGVLSLATFLLGTLGGRPHWLLTALLYLVLLAMAVLGGREALRLARAAGAALKGWRRGTSRGEIALFALAALTVLLALAKANVPVFLDYDSLEYHLAAPAQWWRQGRVSFIPDVVYTNFPQNVEMLYLLAMCCFGGPMRGAAVGLQLGVGFIVLAALGVAAAGRRLKSPAAGRLGALIFLTTPMLAELATLNSYVVELPLSAYSFLALFAFLLYWRAEGVKARWRLVVLAGLMSGLALGCKYPAALFLVAPLGGFFLVGGVLGLRRAREAIGACALSVAVALLAASPWFVRNALNTGNPVYPLLYRVFDGANWSAEQDVRFRMAHAPSDGRFVGLAPRFLRFGFWRDAFPASPALFLFALVPIALADRRSAAPVLYASTVFLAFGALGRFIPPEQAGPAPMAATLLGCGVLGVACSALGRRLWNPVVHVALIFLALGAALWVSRNDLVSPGALGQLVTATTVLALVGAPAFLVRRGAAAFPAVHFVFWLMAWYFLTHRLDRFLDPATPAVALLAGLGAAALAGPRLGAAARAVVGFGLAYAILTTYVAFAPLMWLGLAEPPDRFLRQAAARSTYCHQLVERINELPEDATVLFVGESRTFYCRRRALAATLFDRSPLERILAAEDNASHEERVASRLHKLGVTHLYVNWQELGRLASTYPYRFGGRQHQGVPIGLYRRLLERMERAGYLSRVAAYGPEVNGRLRPDFVLYRLR